MKISCDGLVLYTDGSFRRQQAGWGVHGYAYTLEPLTATLGSKQVPTVEGYQTVELSQSVTPIAMIDAYGPVTKNPTNNTGELQGVISALELANKEYDTNRLLLLMDSEYVRKGAGYVAKWEKNHWVKADGSPVANQDYWKNLTQARHAWESQGRTVEFRWVKGHNGDLGNERADANALLGSGGKPVEHTSSTAPSAGKFKGEELNPLIMKSRLLWTVDGNPPSNDGYYCLYHLGRLHGYGIKTGIDTELDKIRKTDLVLGRRNSEACYSVYKAVEPETYIETLKQYHANAHARDVIDLAVLRLDNAYNAKVLEQVANMGEAALINLEQLKALTSAQDTLVSITLDPPRMALLAVERFNLLRRRLDDVLEERVGAGTLHLDVTELLYGKVQAGKKEITKLHKTITNNTQFLEYETVHGVKPVKLRLVFGLDIPDRNMLARIASLEPKVSLLVVADGPVSYSFSTVFQTSKGAAIFQAPDANFVWKP